MKRFIAGVDRGQSTLLPECLDDWVDDDNPVRAIDVFVDALDLADLGFAGVTPSVTGRTAYHPSVLLKLYIYGYLNRVQSSRRLEREAGRNLEVIWLLGRLAPDDKVIADFRKDNGPAIRQVCARFVDLCRETVEHPFGTLKMRMGATHFLMKRLPKVATEMALHVLAYNLTRVVNIMGVKPLMAAMRA